MPALPSAPEPRRFTLPKPQQKAPGQETGLAEKAQARASKRKGGDIATGVPLLFTGPLSDRSSPG